jgi:RNA polymerase sigma factor (sigma-70 family)
MTSSTATDAATSQQSRLRRDAPSRRAAPAATAAANSALVLRLFLAHGHALQRYFARRVRPRSDAQELAQEVYLRLLRVPDASALRNPEGYLYAIAANLIKERAAQQRLRRNCVSLEDAAFPEALSEEPSWPDTLDTARHAARLREVLRELPLKCQAAVTLCYWHGLSYAEIAQRLGISVNMVKKYLVCALALCRRRMAHLR